MSTNILRMDPTRTGMIRRSFEAEIKRRLNQLRRAVWHAVVTRNELEGREEPVANAFKFPTSVQKVPQFNRWLKKQIDDKVLEASPTSGEPKGAKPWTYKYVDSAYKKGAHRAYTDIRPELAKKMPGYADTRKGFLDSAFNRPERVSKLRLLYTRSYESLKGVTSQMAAQMSRVLADGVAHGKSPTQIASSLSKSITGISKARARVIARTEVIYAHAEGQLDAFEDLGVKEVNAEVEFTTAGDDGVCPKCDALSGRTYTIAQARGVIPVHPNCRCSWTPVIVVPRLRRARRR